MQSSILPNEVMLSTLKRTSLPEPSLPESTLTEAHRVTEECFHGDFKPHQVDNGDEPSQASCYKNMASDHFP